MAFRDWEEVAALPLPIFGKTYQIKPMTAAAVARVMQARDAIRQHLANVAAAEQEDTEPPEPPEPPEGLLTDEEFYRLTLGDSLDELRADLGNVGDNVIKRAALVAQADAEHGRDVAEHLWEKGPDPEALAAEIKAATLMISKDSTPSPSTGVANATRPPANTTTTTSRRTSSGRTKAAKSAGAKSSRSARSS